MSDHPQLLSIFCDALECRSAPERAAFLDRACGADLALRARVEELLHSHQCGPHFLEGDSSDQTMVATVDDPIAEGPGTVLGAYKLRQIGEGGFGVVFLAEQ
jgi:hypothetical protein